MRRLTAAVVLLAVWLGASPASAAWAPDAWVTLKVKIALLSVVGIDPGVDVDTLEGNVTLHGKATSEKARRGAESAAKAVAGVTSVRNLLQVVSRETARRTRRSDAKIRERATEVLAKDEKLSGSAIVVASVNKGLVRLTGTVKDWQQQLRATKRVRAVPGVRAVVSEVGFDETTLDAAIWDERELDGEGREIDEAAADLWLTMNVKLALLAVAEIDGLDINVDTRGGQVTLFGLVASTEARNHALRVAKSVEGVAKVHDELQVVPVPRRAVVAARDEAIAARVPARIYEIPEMKGSAIAAEVKNGVVRLTGSVPTTAHRLRAAQAARRVEGVRAVLTDLVVRRMTHSTRGG